MYNKTMVKAVVFDCFGVLYGGSTTYFTSLVPDRKQDISDLNNQHDYGFISNQEYAERMAEIAGMRPQDVEEVLNTRHVRHPEVFDIVRYAKEQGAKTGLLTNMGQHMLEHLFTEEELHGGLFDAYIASSDVGVIKPSVEIFRMISEKLGVEPEHCIMVDDIEANCNGAQLAGMQSVWFADATTAASRVRDFLEQP